MFTYYFRDDTPDVKTPIGRGAKPKGKRGKPTRPAALKEKSADEKSDADDIDSRYERI